MAKTVDNLGVEISSRFAKDLEQTQSELISESKIVSPKTQIDITVPAFKSAYDSMFGFRQHNKTWALFARPTLFERANARVFGFHLLPSIRTDEFGLMEKERIQARKEAKKKRFGEKPPREYDWEERYDDEEEKKESDILLFFIDAIAELDKSLIDINGRRSQYQKG